MNSDNLKLSLIEAHRVVAIIEETIEKLRFLESITPDVLQHRDELSKFVGDEISRIIQEQRVLETRYEELIAQRSALKGLSNKSKYKEVQDEIKDVSQALRESTKNLCRNLKENPNIQGNLQKIQRERTALIELLTRANRELKETNYLNILINMVEEDRLSQTRLRDMVHREKETSAAVQKLKADIEQEKEEHKLHVEAQKAHITELKEKLLSTRSKTSVDVKYKRKEANAKTESSLRVHQQDEASLKKKIENLRHKKQVEEVVHQRTVDFLKEKHQNLQNSWTEWDKKNQDDVSEIQMRLDKLSDKRNANFIKLCKLQKRQEEQNKEAMRRKLEEEQQKDTERRLAAEMERKNIAATKLQRVLRFFYLKRKEEQAKKEAEKKAKKAAKAKKKK